MLVERLQELGVKFGDFPVISNLTNTVFRTQSNVIARLALISIVHEGKGIRSLSRLKDKILACRDEDSLKILKIIESEELYHFETGLKWFKYFVQQKFREEAKYGKSISSVLFMQNTLNKINSEYRVSITLKDVRERESGAHKD